MKNYDKKSEKYIEYLTQLEDLDPEAVYISTSDGQIIDLYDEDDEELYR